MVAQHFSHVRHWVFDLDNTLYPPAARLFDQIEEKMNAWVMRELSVDHVEADRLRADYWREHGTTLAGLMANHKVEPWDYLREVHDISLDMLEPDEGLARSIRALPGRRIVYTNGDGEYAERVLERRGLSDVFDAIYGIEHANWRPKPERAAFDLVFAAERLEPKTAAMFEDDIRNLSVPHALGMRTVHVAPEPDPQPHIHHHTDDLPGFLAMLT
ncbi:pyrimidine 5'-nucleotidase [Pseudoruegeria sp. HB172150]|uniref:pyrimidine 5'-nucleotidase n=1 Tax=Pseudoruegeria sp. HB172150 TaxID=2721164 RepID=UPI00155333B6|nr:pyrimidine 5'-nucleotidase [Pseudoruegeria sp. HB172150]